jgi:hypothetical protein
MLRSKFPKRTRFRTTIMNINRIQANSMFRGVGNASARLRSRLGNAGEVNATVTGTIGKRRGVMHDLSRGK